MTQTLPTRRAESVPDTARHAAVKTVCSGSTATPRDEILQLPQQLGVEGRGIEGALSRPQYFALDSGDASSLDGSDCEGGGSTLTTPRTNELTLIPEDLEESAMALMEAKKALGAKQQDRKSAIVQLHAKITAMHSEHAKRKEALSRLPSVAVDGADSLEGCERPGSDLTATSPMSRWASRKQSLVETRKFSKGLDLYSQVSGAAEMESATPSSGSPRRLVSFKMESGPSPNSSETMRRLASFKMESRPTLGKPTSPSAARESWCRQASCKARLTAAEKALQQLVYEVSGRVPGGSMVSTGSSESWREGLDEEAACVARLSAIETSLLQLMHELYGFEMSPVSTPKDAAVDDVWMRRLSVVELAMQELICEVVGKASALPALPGLASPEADAQSSGTPPPFSSGMGSEDDVVSWAETELSAPAGAETRDLGSELAGLRDTAAEIAALCARRTPSMAIKATLVGQMQVGEECHDLALPLDGRMPLAPFLETLTALASSSPAADEEPVHMEGAFDRRDAGLLGFFTNATYGELSNGVLSIYDLRHGGERDLLDAQPLGDSYSVHRISPLTWKLVYSGATQKSFNFTWCAGDQKAADAWCHALEAACAVNKSHEAVRDFARFLWAEVQAPRAGASSRPRTSLPPGKQATRSLHSASRDLASRLDSLSGRCAGAPLGLASKSGTASHSAV